MLKIETKGGEIAINANLVDAETGQPEPSLRTIAEYVVVEAELLGPNAGISHAELTKQNLKPGQQIEVRVTANWDTQEIQAHSNQAQNIGLSTLLHYQDAKKLKIQARLPRKQPAKLERHAFLIEVQGPGSMEPSPASSKTGPRVGAGESPTKKNRTTPGTVEKLANKMNETLVTPHPHSPDWRLTGDAERGR